MVQPVAEGSYAAALAAAGVPDPATVTPGSLAPITSLDVGGLMAAVGATSLSFGSSTVVAQVHAALVSGKHLLLQGAPGTGKTTLATIVAECAEAKGVCRGAAQITGSSDWSPADTVGSYKVSRTGELEFVPGQILTAIAKQAWVVIDELNRADIDRAMGPMFSLLSGHPAELRYEEEHPPGLFRRVAIVPEGKTLGPSTREYIVPASWRIIATMNTKDLDLLFEVSQAFLRRFAVVTVPVPDVAAHKALLAPFAVGNPAIDAMVERVVSLPDAPLGPAITLDFARWVKARWSASSGGKPSAKDLATEGFDLFIAHQLVGLDRPSRERARTFLANGPAASTSPVPSTTPSASPTAAASPTGPGSSTPAATTVTAPPDAPADDADEDEGFEETDDE